MSTGAISREEINQLPIRRYEGPVHLVGEPHELAQAMADFRRESVLGLDTETRPAFRAGESYLPALAQLATARAVYLFQLQRLDCSAALREVLSEERIVKAGVGLADDLRQLRKSFPFVEKAMVDLSAVAKAQGMERTGVRTLAAAFLGFRIPKGAKTSNWAAARLTPQQIAYAAMDAWACRELYLEFKRLGWV
ncbi:MAG TPA: 3'-5' exonuclease [Burkholderiales bacterium]|nr:3'-5' exonuclease [Burkholderiales bacterium]